jgi:hypothetical protein
MSILATISPTTDPGVADAINGLSGLLTGTVAPAVFGIAASAVAIVFGLRWLKKGAKQA